jgi:hypothetical protein
MPKNRRKKFQFVLDEFICYPDELPLLQLLVVVLVPQVVHLSHHRRHVHLYHQHISVVEPEP